MRVVIVELDSQFHNSENSLNSKELWGRFGYWEGGGWSWPCEIISQ